MNLIIDPRRLFKFKVFLFFLIIFPSLFEEILLKNSQDAGFRWTIVYRIIDIISIYRHVSKQTNYYVTKIGEWKVEGHGNTRKIKKQVCKHLL